MYKRKKSSLQLAFVTATCFITGLLLVIALQVNSSSSNALPVDSRNQTLIDVIETLEAETEKLQMDLDALKLSMEKAVGTGGADPAGIAALQAELDKLRFLADLTETEGPGLILTLDDNSIGAEAAKKSEPNSFVAANYIIHDTNLRYLLNDVMYLTEAVSINGQRIVTTSDIRCVGTVIMVNSVRLAPPYEIKMIGPSSILESAVEQSRHYSALKDANFPLKIRKENNLTLPAYTGPTSSVYAVIHENKTEGSVVK